MATPKKEANQFDLHGDHTAISYATTSFGGKATFDYKAGDKHARLTGSDIRLLDTEIGKLVTVSIDDGNDGGDSLVTLVVPKLSLVGLNETVQFDTIAVVTAIRRLGPAHQHYKALRLHGTAKFVTF